MYIDLITSGLITCPFPLFPLFTFSIFSRILQLEYAVIFSNENGSRQTEQENKAQNTMNIFNIYSSTNLSSLQFDYHVLADFLEFC